MKKQSPQEDNSQPENESSLELTPEQEQVLDQKREQLLQGDDLCLRFVYHKEYQDLVENGWFRRPKIIQNPHI